VRWPDEKSDEAQLPPSVSNFYVDNIDETLKKVSEAGGQVIAPKTSIPNIGAWALFFDPDKIPVGLFESKKG